MKLATVIAVLAAAAVNAKTVLEPFNGPVEIGKTYTVSWVSDSPDTLQLEVVKRTPHGWTPSSQLFKGKHVSASNGHYQWTVDEGFAPDKGYALWLKGKEFADLSQWFKIEE